MSNYDDSLAYINKLYNDFKIKKKNIKLKNDDLKAEIIILEKEVNYILNNIDNSNVFSPRSKDNPESDIDSLRSKIDEYNIILNDNNRDLEYYNNSLEHLKFLIDYINNNDSSVSYNLSLNYTNDTSVKKSLSKINHKLDTCLKIFDSDSIRTKNELKNIKNSIDSLINSLD